MNGISWMSILRGLLNWLGLLPRNSGDQSGEGWRDCGRRGIMLEYYAHSLENKPEEEWQTLDAHLTEVAAMAEEFAKAIRPNEKLFAELARLAGLLHDLGKYQARDRLIDILNHASEKIKTFEFKEVCPTEDMTETKLSYEILIRMLFSLLVDADRLNTEEWEKRQLFGSQWKRKSVSINPIALLQKLQDKRTEKSNSSKND